MSVTVTASAEAFLKEQYLKVLASSDSKGDLAVRVRELQRELATLLTELAAQQQASPNIDLSNTWLAELKTHYPEIKGIGTTAVQDTLYGKLQTEAAPMYFVRHGQAPMYISMPVIQYNLKFSPTGYCYGENVSQDISYRAAVPASWPYFEDHGPNLVIRAYTHPHSGSGTHRRFSEFCTGGTNPFVNILSGGAMPVSAAQLKTGFGWALRWLRTYNTNDAYGSSVFKVRNPEYANDPASTGLLLNAYDDVCSALTMGFSELQTGLARALAEMHNHLVAFKSDDPSTYEDFPWSTETKDLWSWIRTDLGDTLGRMTSPLSVVLFRALHWVATRTREVDPEEETARKDYLRSRLYNVQYEAQGPMPDRVKDLDWDEDATCLYKYLSFLYFYQLLYAQVLLISTLKNEQQIMSPRNALSLLVRDILIVRGTTTLGFPRAFVPMWGWKALRTGEKRITGAAVPEKVFAEYHECLPNLFNALNPSALGEGKIFDKVQTFLGTTRETSRETSQA